MFKNFWYAIEFTHEITGKPKKLTVLGQDLVAFRTASGAPVVMSDLCVHRGGALSGGWVQGECVVCPYHGWEYEPSGACVKIPANRAGLPIPKKARVDSYPAVDRSGFLWAFLGDLPEDERLPLPELPFWGDPEFKPMFGEFLWNANYERVVENGLDFAHAPFVHGGNFGNRDKPEVPELEFEDFETGCIAAATLEPPPAKGRWRRVYDEERPGVYTRTGFFMPNVTLLEVNLPLGRLALLDANVPIDEHHTLTKWIALRTFFKGNWADRNARMRVMRIFHQDAPIVEGQRPELVPIDLDAELHVKADALQLRYRKLRDKYLEKGWAIDRHRIGYAGHHATVIPSPARREHPELANAWVLKEIESQSLSAARADD